MECDVDDLAEEKCDVEDPVQECDTKDQIQEEYDEQDSEADDADLHESSHDESPRRARSAKASRVKDKRKTNKTVAPPRASSRHDLLLRPRAMVITFRSDIVDPPATFVMGSDKHENDHLISQATEQVLFFHVNDLPSAHVYLQLEPGQGLRDVPRALLQDAAQLCKANSSQGNKMSNVMVIYTLGSNLLKSRQMKAGEVGFVNDKEVRKILVAKRDDKIMNRLNQTKEKVLSAKSQREKEQRARERQRQKAEAKQQKRIKRQQQQKQQEEGPEEQTEEEQDLTWGTEVKQLPVACNQGRMTRRQRRAWREQEDDSDVSQELQEEEEQTSTAAVTSRCFPVAAEQRKVLQGCRALVERRFDVWVEPPLKGKAEGRVTGAPDDVADALAELRKLLCPARKPEAAAPTKGKTGKAKDGKAKDGKAKDGKAKDGKAKDGKAKDGKAKDGKAKDGKAKDKQSTGKQKKK